MNYQAANQPDTEELTELVAYSFNRPIEKVQPWITGSGIENWRLVRKPQGKIVAGLLVIPMGQWYNKQRVSMTGIAGVAVSAASRGRGVGQFLMHETLKEIRQERSALSALYATTTSFYRHCGYEQAGGYYRFEVAIRDLRHRSGPLQVQPLKDDHSSELTALQQQYVRGDTCLDRSDYVWNRVRSPRGATTKRVGFFNEDKLEGYVYYTTSDFQGLSNTMEISDLVLTTPEAQETFLGFLASHRSFFTKATWASPTTSPLHLAFEDPWSYKFWLQEHWMLRVVDVEQALTERGYRGDGELHLAISDPLLSNNEGNWLLKVENGKGSVSRGGRGELSLDISALSPLYTGFLPTQQLQQAGKLVATDSACRQADTLFAGTPTLADFF